MRHEITTVRRNHFFTISDGHVKIIPPKKDEHPTEKTTAIYAITERYTDESKWIKFITFKTKLLQYHTPHSQDLE